MNTTPILICYLILALGNMTCLVLLARRNSRLYRGLSKSIDLASLGTYAMIGLLGAVGTALGHPPGLPSPVKDVLNEVITPALLTALWLVWTAILLWRPEVVSSGWLFWHGVNWGGFWFLLSLTDPHFAALVFAPDHMAVIFLIASAFLFIWLGLRLSILNDHRLERGRNPREKTRSEETRIFVWPDLVYIELIAMLAMTCVLGIWSLTVPAPLEAPADTSWTPNPAKAPWYFVGLQELLVYFEPWFAGVVLPLVIVFGLCLIPYLRRQDNQSGFYWLKGRRFSVAIFLSGFGLWILLIVIGTFFRGPDWRLYGLYESRLVRRFTELHTEPLSTRVWRAVLHSEDRSTAITSLVNTPVLRELPGLLVVILLFLVIPLLAKRTFGTGLASRLGPSGYWTVAILLAMMTLIPIKMCANWLFDINYFVYLPEIGLSL